MPVFLILISFIVSILLMLTPWVEPLRYFFPNWSFLLLIYWVVCFPLNINFFVAFILGLTVDVASGSIIGQHAFANVLVVYVVLATYLRFRLYPVWQQALFVSGFYILYQIALIMFNIIFDAELLPLLYYIPPIITSIIFWPIITVILKVNAR